MLDRMRRHMDWLKWSLGLVVVAFILFYIPDFLRGSGADAASGDTIASVQGREITTGEFRRTYQAQLQAYRSAYGANMSDSAAQTSSALTADPPADGRRRAALAEADLPRRLRERRGSAQRIFSTPAFQENGAHRRAALPAAAADAAAAARALGVRRSVRRRSSSTSCARRSPTGSPCRTGLEQGSTAAHGGR